jgi:hypothetical protein
MAVYFDNHTKQISTHREQNVEPFTLKQYIVFGPSGSNPGHVDYKI